MSKATLIWDVLDQAREAHEPMPTVRELAERLGFSSTSVVEYHMKTLESANIISRDPGKARSIRVLKPFPRTE